MRTLPSIMRDTDAVVLLTNRAMSAKASAVGVPTIVVDDDPVVAGQFAGNLGLTAHSEQLAYASGEQSDPDGVVAGASAQQSRGGHALGQPGEVAAGRRCDRCSGRRCHAVKCSAHGRAAAAGWHPCRLGGFGPMSPRRRFCVRTARRAVDHGCDHWLSISAPERRRAGAGGAGHPMTNGPCRGLSS